MLRHAFGVELSNASWRDWLLKLPFGKTIIVVSCSKLSRFEQRHKLLKLWRSSQCSHFCALHNQNAIHVNTLPAKGPVNLWQGYQTLECAKTNQTQKGRAHRDQQNATWRWRRSCTDTGRKSMTEQRQEKAKQVNNTGIEAHGAHSQNNTARDNKKVNIVGFFHSSFFLGRVLFLSVVGFVAVQFCVSRFWFVFFLWKTWSWCGLWLICWSKDELPLLREWLGAARKK